MEAIYRSINLLSFLTTLFRHSLFSDTALSWFFQHFWATSVAASTGPVRDHVWQVSRIPFLLQIVNDEACTRRPTISVHNRSAECKIPTVPCINLFRPFLPSFGCIQYNSNVSVGLYLFYSPSTCDPMIGEHYHRHRTQAPNLGPLYNRIPLLAVKPALDWHQWIPGR